jgi:hypothetical protein
MDRMPRYIPARERSFRLTRHRGKALFEFVRAQADMGDERAASFLDALAAGAFDDAQSDTGLRIFVKPYTSAEKASPWQK